jgi:hypothetical protein
MYGIYTTFLRGLHKLKSYIVVSQNIKLQLMVNSLSGREHRIIGVKLL